MFELRFCRLTCYNKQNNTIHMYDVPWLIVVVGWTVLFVTYSVTKLKTHRCGGGIYTMEITIANEQKWIIRLMMSVYIALAGLFTHAVGFEQLDYFYRGFSDFFVLHGTILFVIALALYIDARLVISSNCSWKGRFKKDRHKLIQHGPYKKIRHPQPLACFLALISTSFLTNDARIFVFALLLVPMGFAYAMIHEQYLYWIFPEYKEYVKKTGRFLLP
ncbi:hypothetical protein GF369_03855 [Candidatus Peregrinibacteria bacterium]|nr:hypothetical protein [Candidatus Peregrinibacteria bacterium]